MQSQTTFDIQTKNSLKRNQQQLLEIITTCNKEIISTTISVQSACIIHFLKQGPLFQHADLYFWVSRYLGDATDFENTYLFK